MQFGIPALIEIKSLEDCAALCRELGFVFVELNMNLPNYQADKLDLDELYRIANEYGIYFTIHFDENLSPCDFNERVATAYTETVLQTIDIAKRLSAPILNMHMNPGVWFTMPDKKVFLFEKYESEYMLKLTAFRDACTAAIGSSDIQICVENCGDYGDKPYIQKGLALLLQSPAFALTFDVGHNAGAGYSDEPTIMEHKNKLAHFHIHDAKGKSNHLLLGEGDVDLLKYLDLAMAYNCRAVIEVKTIDGLRRSMGWLKARGWL